MRPQWVPERKKPASPTYNSRTNPRRAGAPEEIRTPDPQIRSLASLLPLKGSSSRDGGHPEHLVPMAPLCPAAAATLHFHSTAVSIAVLLRRAAELRYRGNSPENVEPTTISYSTIATSQALNMSDQSGSLAAFSAPICQPRSSGCAKPFRAGCRRLLLAGAGACDRTSANCRSNSLIRSRSRASSRRSGGST